MGDWPITCGLPGGTTAGTEQRHPPTSARIPQDLGAMANFVSVITPRSPPRPASAPSRTCSRTCRLPPHPGCTLSASASVFRKGGFTAGEECLFQVSQHIHFGGKKERKKRKGKERINVSDPGVLAQYKDS